MGDEGTGDEERQTKPEYAWRDRGDMQEAMREAIDYFGHFPTMRELRGNGYNDLAAAVQMYHGGILKVREGMGYNPADLSGNLELPDVYIVVLNPGNDSSGLDDAVLKSTSEKERIAREIGEDGIQLSDEELRDIDDD
jgi:hypothetical protein